MTSRAVRVALVVALTAAAVLSAVLTGGGWGSTPSTQHHDASGPSFTSHQTPTRPSPAAPRAGEDRRAASPSRPASAVGPALAPSSAFGAMYPASAGAVRGALAPRYTAVPAPMGVSDFGVDSGGPYAYYTSSFNGSLAIQSFSAFEPGYVLSPPFQAPDWALAQLDAVAVNITVPPSTPGDTFWAENGVHLNTTSLVLEDNIWNFTGPGANVTPSTLTGTVGHVYLGQYYAGFGSVIAISYPLTITLYENISLSGSHDQLIFGYSLVDPSIHQGGTYDKVTFTGTAVPTHPPAFEVNGTISTPSGMLYDAELVVGGNGGGHETNIVQLTGTATLHELTPHSGYVPIRAGYDFGSDSSSTAMGVAVHFLGNSSAVADLTQGPSVLYGLWNTSSGAIAPEAKPGYINVQLTTTPAYAFLFLELPGGGYSYAPSTAAGVTSAELPPPYVASPYTFGAWADGFAPDTGVPNVVDNASGTQTVTLVTAPGTEDAPVYLDGDAQVTEFAANLPNGAQYSSAAKTLWLNASKDALAAPFLDLNPVGYPGFQLFAAEKLSTNVVVDAFRQDPSTYNYTCYTGPCGQELRNWSQAYSFFGGTGKFTVENTTIEGVQVPIVAKTPVFSVPTIEFYLTSGSIAKGISVVADARGVSAIGATSLVVSNVSEGTGGVGVYAANSTMLRISRLSVEGFDASNRPSTGLVLNGDMTVHVSAVSALDGSVGLLFANSSFVTVINVTVSGGAIGVRSTNTADAYVSGFNVSASTASVAGFWNASQSVSFLYVTVNGTGLTFADDSGISVTNGTALGFGSAVVESFLDSTQGDFTSILAENGAAGINASQSNNLTFHYLNAEYGSVGAVLNFTKDVSANGIFASVNSTGVLWSSGTRATFTNVDVSALSLGVWVSNGTKASVTDVTAANNSLGSSDYFTNGTSLIFYPVAGVAVFNASHVNVSNVEATDYPFGVWTNDSHHLNVSSVVGWYGFTTVQENNTSYGNLSQVFSFGSDFGIAFYGCNRTNILLSTLEDSVLLGLGLNGGGNDSVTDNNFVGNNGSSVSGSYSSSHVQIWANQTFGPHFANNYFADFGGAGTYPINFTGDKSPLSAFYGTYFEFTESGLAGGEAWGVLFGSLPIITADISAVYLPGWVLSSGNLAFLVVAPTGVAASPRNGTVAWAGATLSPINIQFGSSSGTSGILGVPVWEFATIVGAVAVAAALGAVLLLRRRRRPRAPSPSQYVSMDDHPPP